MGEFKEKLLLKEFIEWGAETFDRLAFKKGWPDLVDKLAMKGVLNGVNAAFSDDVRDDIKPDLWEAQQKVIAQDYDDGGAEAMDALLVVLKSKEFKGKEVVVGTVKVLRDILAELD